jgi:hypothetical protein
MDNTETLATLCTHDTRQRQYRDTGNGTQDTRQRQYRDTGNGTQDTRHKTNKTQHKTEN